jgi:hypothetical protein
MTETIAAGRELDALVAEKVMGWQRGRRYGNGNGEWIIDGKTSVSRTWDSTPHYSTDIAAAWLVVERTTRERDWRWQISVVRGLAHVWLVPIWHAATEADLRAQPDYMVEDETAPLAICRAALVAIGHIQPG